MENVWKLRAFDSQGNAWKTQLVGGDELFAQMMSDLLRWKAEGQQVRLEWSEKN
jgi:hypothetical protein